MKRSQLLAAAGAAAALAACGGDGSTGLDPLSRLLQPKKNPLGGSGSCDYGVTVTKGNITAKFSCASGFWANGEVFLDPKHGIVFPYADISWCKNPPSQCSNPHSLRWMFSWANDPKWRWDLKDELIDLWNEWQWKTGEITGNGHLYQNGTLVGKGVLDQPNQILYLTDYRIGSGKTYDIQFQVPYG